MIIKGMVIGRSSFHKANTTHSSQKPEQFFLVSILGFLVNTVDLPIYLPSVKASLYLHPLNT